MDRDGRTHRDCRQGKEHATAHAQLAGRLPLRLRCLGSRPRRESGGGGGVAGAERPAALPPRPSPAVDARHRRGGRRAVYGGPPPPQGGLLLGCLWRAAAVMRRGRASVPPRAGRLRANRGLASVLGAGPSRSRGGRGERVARPAPRGEPFRWMPSVLWGGGGCGGCPRRQRGARAGVTRMARERSIRRTRRDGARRWTLARQYAPTRKPGRTAVCRRTDHADSINQTTIQRKINRSTPGAPTLNHSARGQRPLQTGTPLRGCPVTIHKGKGRHGAFRRWAPASRVPERLARPHLWVLDGPHKGGLKADGPLALPLRRVGEAQVVVDRLVERVGKDAALPLGKHARAD